AVPNAPLSLFMTLVVSSHAHSVEVVLVVSHGYPRWLRFIPGAHSGTCTVPERVASHSSPPANLLTQRNWLLFFPEGQFHRRVHRDRAFQAGNLQWSGH